MEKITISTKINTDITKIWEFYTSPQHIVNWNFAHPSWHCPNATNDLQIGGKYMARMEAKDGSFGFDFEAIYTNVAYLNEITYKMLDNRMATIIFQKETENVSNISISFDPETQNSLELQKNGWQAILDNFKVYCENN